MNFTKLSSITAVRERMKSHLQRSAAVSLQILQCFTIVFLHDLQEQCVCVCFGHIAVTSPSSTRYLVLTGHQTLLLAVINTIILELFSLRDILCGMLVLRPSGFGRTLVDDTHVNTRIVVC